MWSYSAALAAVWLASTQVLAETTPLVVTGPLDSWSVKDETKFNSGGSLSVLGHDITIPDNLLVEFPAAYIPWAEFVGSASKFSGYEVVVDGNFVDGVPIAGRVGISQTSTTGGVGTVSAVNNDGTLSIAGGPNLRINTPEGVFAKAYTENPFFTVDEANPSICSFSGYPMCIPRSANDPDCPSNNRGTNRVYTPTNTSAMAPFRVGDFVSYAGVKNGGNEVLCFEIVAENVQQLTRGSSGDPVYVRLEDALIGIVDSSTGTEFAGNRFVGYLSDATASVTIYRLDVDPCTGEEDEVQIATGSPRNGDVRNKFDISFDDTGNSNVAREYRVKASKGYKKVAFGIQAGQYTSPITEVIWPEVDVPGSVWPPNALQLFGHLKNGFVLDKHQFGQLKPWPGASAPSTSKTCTGKELDEEPPAEPTTEKPIADAGAKLTGQLAGSRITIAGSQTNSKLASNQVTFAWTGPSNVEINNADKATMNFINPWASTSTDRTFTLTVCLKSDSTVCDKSTVVVTTDKTADKVTITGYTFESRQSGSISVTATSTNLLVGANGANLQLRIGTSNTWINMEQDTTNLGRYTYSANKAGKQPAQIAVRSTKNTTPVTTSTFITRRSIQQAFNA